MFIQLAGGVVATEVSGANGMDVAPDEPWGAELALIGEHRGRLETGEDSGEDDKDLANEIVGGRGALPYGQTDCSVLHP